MNMKFKKTLISAGIAASLLFTGFASAKVMNMGIVLSPDSHYGKGADVFAQEMDRLSNGKYEIKIKSLARGKKRNRKIVVLNTIYVFLLALTSKCIWGTQR